MFFFGYLNSLCAVKSDTNPLLYGHIVALTSKSVLSVQYTDWGNELYNVHAANKSNSYCAKWLSKNNLSQTEHS